MNKLRAHIIFFSIFIIIFIAWTFPVILQLNKAVYGPMFGTDNRAAIWHFGWFHYSFAHQMPVETNILANYPYGADRMSPQFFPVCMIPAYVLSIIFGELAAYNLLIFSSFTFSFLCMYALVFFVTKKEGPAFIAGLIYTFSPYHVNKSWEHFGLMFIDFIPLYVLGLLMLKQKQNMKRLIFCAAALALVALSDFTYSFIIFVFSILFFIFTLYFDLIKRDQLKNIMRFVFYFLGMALTSFLLVFPIMMGSVRSSIAVKSGGVVTRAISYLFSQGATLLAYLVPSKYHPFFGGLASSLEGSIFFGKGPLEQTLYLGWVGLILAYIFLKKTRRSGSSSILAGQQDYVKFIFSAIFIFAIIFSMPPYWDFFIFKIYFPSFFIHKVFPVFRAYSRFGVLALLSVSVLAGCACAYFIDRAKWKKTVVAVIAILVLFDFMNMPPLRATRLDSCPPVYQWLARQEGDSAIVEYPIRLGDTSEGYVNLDYLLYQRCHKKAMLEGAKPGTEGFRVKQKITNIARKGTPELLKSLGIKYVVIHLAGYRQGDNEGAVEVKGEVPDLASVKGLKFIQKFGDDEVYEIVAEGEGVQ